MPTLAEMTADYRKKKFDIFTGDAPTSYAPPQTSRIVDLILGKSNQVNVAQAPFIPKMVDRQIANIERPVEPLKTDYHNPLDVGKPISDFIGHVVTHPKETAKTLLEPPAKTLVSLADIITRVPEEAVRQVAAPFQTQGNNLDEYLKNLSQKQLDITGRPLMYEKAFNKDVTKPEDAADFVMSAAEAPAYAYGGGALKTAGSVGQKVLQGAKIGTKTGLPFGVTQTVRELPESPQDFAGKLAKNEAMMVGGGAALGAGGALVSAAAKPVFGAIRKDVKAGMPALKNDTGAIQLGGAKNNDEILAKIKAEVDNFNTNKEQIKKDAYGQSDYGGERTMAIQNYKNKAQISRDFAKDPNKFLEKYNLVDKPSQPPISQPSIQGFKGGDGLDALRQEASKYKSAKEFVKSKKTAYHGGSIEDIADFNPENKVGDSRHDPLSNIGINLGDKNTAQYFADRNGGKVVETYLDPKKVKKTTYNNLLHEVADAMEEKSGINYGEQIRGLKTTDAKNKFLIDNMPDPVIAKEIADKYREQGFDMITYKNTLDGGESHIPLTKDAIKTKSQLTDIYNSLKPSGKPNVVGEASVPPEVPIKPPINFRDVTNPQGKTRGFIKTIKSSPKTSPEVSKVEGVYDIAGNKGTIAKANAAIIKDFEGAVYQAKTSTAISKDIQAKSLRLIDELQAKGRHQDAIDVVEATAKRSTTGGQASQILAAYNRLTPEGILAFAQRGIEKAKKTGKFKNLSMTPEQASKLRGMAENIQNLTGEAKAQATRDMLDEIGRIVPTPWARKFTTIVKAGYLSGVKGAVGGNTIGNTAMMVMRKLSDVPATGIDHALALATGNRSKVFTLKGILSGAKEGTLEGVSNMRKGIGAQSLSTKLDYKKAYFSKNPLGRVAQKYTDTVFNFYSAADRPFFHSALKNSLNDLAKVEAKNKGLRGQGAKEFIEKLVKEPPEDILIQAVEEAETAVYQNKTAIGAGLSGAKQGLKRYGGSTGEIVSELGAPFTGVPSAIATAIHHYSPSGMVTETIRAIGEARNGGLSQIGQRKLAEALGKGLTGTAAIYVGSQLTKTGQMTLGYPTDVGERSLWEAEGKMPYSVQIGGQWHSLNYMGPIMSLLAIGGEIEKADGSGVEAIVKGTLGSGRAILSSSPLQGMQGGMNAITDPQRYGNSYLNNLVGGMIPTIIKDFATSGDRTQREVNSVSDALKSRIPGARNTLLPKIDIFGQEVPRGQSDIGSIINPFRSSQARTTDVVSEMRRLQDAGSGPTLAAINKKELSPEDLHALKESSGTQLNQALTSLIGTPEYQSASNEDKMDAVNDLVRAVRKNSGASTVKAGEPTSVNTNPIKKQNLKDNDNLYYQQMISYKKKGDVDSWIQTADKKAENMKAMLQDSSLTEVERLKLQNRLDTLTTDMSKYKGYGGFTKGKSSSGTKKASSKGSTKKVAKPKALKKMKVAKGPAVRMKAYKPKTVKTKGFAQIVKNSRRA